MKRLRIITTTLALAIAPAFAGTTAIDFTQGLTGLKHLGNTGNITVDENCNGVFGGTATYLVANGNSYASSTGIVSITMGVTPADDVTLAGDLGLLVMDAYTTEYAMALVSQTGLVTLSNRVDSRTDTVQFPAPAAGNAAFTLSFNTNTSTATVTVAGSSSSASLNNLFLTGEDSIYVGVVSLGGGKFRELSATGSDIPNLDNTGTCGGEGEGEGEGSPTEGEGEGDPEGEGEGEELPELTVLGGGLVEDGDAIRLGIQVDPGFTAYQWRKDGVNLGGETSPELVRDPVNLVDAGEYDVVVDTGSKAIVTSAPTVVTVVPSNSLPVGGSIALAILCGAIAVAARRRNDSR